jgi:hypothetical protein
VVNTGNVQLREVQISTALSGGATTGLSAYSCTSAAINSGTSFQLGVAGTTLPHAATMTCTASYAFDTIDKIEAAEIVFTASVTAADLGSTVDGGASTVTVIKLPQVSVTLSDPTCPGTIANNFEGVLGRAPLESWELGPLITHD